ncbi:MAG: acyl carrier protein, partial [Actinomycetota bacterium]|nr:acyl carrier protein [Actinomycetota bacterium]
ADDNQGVGAPGSGLSGGLFEAVQAADAQERQRLLETYLRDLVAGKLGLAPSGLDVTAPLNNLGVDSLITLELRIQVERELGIVVPVARLLDGPSVDSLAGWLSEQLAAGEHAERIPVPGTGAAPDVALPTPESDVLAQVSDLSDEAVDALLAKMIADGEHAQDGGNP